MDTAKRRMMSGGIAGLILAAAATLAAEQHASRPADPYERLTHDLKLSDKQAGPVRKILDDYRRDMTAWVAKIAPEVRALRAQMAKIHRGQDDKSREAAEKALARFRELRIEEQARKDALVQRLGKVLDQKQLATVGEALDPRPPAQPPDSKFHLLERLNLSAAQQAKLKETMHAAGAVEGDAKAKAAALQRAWQRITREVLTPEDLRKLEEMSADPGERMVRSMLRGLTLSEDQSAKVEAILAAAHAKAASKPQGRFEVYQAAYEEILAKVLTPEQRKKTQRPMMPAHGGK